MPLYLSIYMVDKYFPTPYMKDGPYIETGF